MACLNCSLSIVVGFEQKTIGFPFCPFAIWSRTHSIHVTWKHRFLTRGTEIWSTRAASLICTFLSQALHIEMRAADRPFPSFSLVLSEAAKPRLHFSHRPNSQSVVPNNIIANPLTVRLWMLVYSPASRWPITWIGRVKHSRRSCGLFSMLIHNHYRSHIISKVQQGSHDAQAQNLFAALHLGTDTDEAERHHVRMRRLSTVVIVRMPYILKLHTNPDWWPYIYLGFSLVS